MSGETAREKVSGKMHARGETVNSSPRARLPDTTHVGRVVLQISNLDRSLGFYQELIGFRLIERSQGDARWARLGTQDGSALLELREKPGVKPVPRRGLLGLYHFALLLPDRPALGRLVKHLRRTGTRVGAADHLFSEALYLEDPDGLTVEVYRDRPRSEWPSRNDELVSASDPLDFAGLVQQSGDRTWDGVPARSVIGHVHFYVGDIPRAEAFYHRAAGFDKTISSWPGALFMSAGGYHHHVGVNTWIAGAPIASSADAKLIEWELVVADARTVADVIDRLRTAGYDTDSSGRAVDSWGIVMHVIDEADWNDRASL